MQVTAWVQSDRWGRRREQRRERPEGTTGGNNRREQKQNSDVWGGLSSRPQV